MTLKGAIGNIVFFNAENGYTVFQLISDSDGGETTCVGYLPQLNVGQQIEVSGKIVTHQKFGEQFSVDKIFPCRADRLGGACQISCKPD